VRLQERRLQERQHLRLGRQPRWELRLRPLHRLRRLARHVLSSREPCSAWRLLQWARTLHNRTRLRLPPAASVLRLVVHKPAVVSVLRPEALHQVVSVLRPEALHQVVSVLRPGLLNQEALVLLLVPRRTIHTALLPAHRRHRRTASLINRSTRSAAPWSRTPARSIRTGSLRNRKAASAVLHLVVHKLAVRKLAVLLPVVTVVRRRAVATALPIRVQVVATVVRRKAATVVRRKAATAARRRAVLQVAVTVVRRRLVVHKALAATVLRQAAATARRNPAVATAACPPAALRWRQSALAEGRSGRRAIRSWCS